MDSRRRRRTKSGEAPPASPGGGDKKKRYNLRKRAPEQDVLWVDDDTLDDDSSDDSDYEPAVTRRPMVAIDEESEEEEDTHTVHGITLPASVPVSVKIHIHTNVETSSEEDEEDEDEEEEEDLDDTMEEDEEEEEEDSVTEEEIAQLLAEAFGAGKRGRQSSPILIIEKPIREEKKEEKVPLALSRREREYLEGLPRSQHKKVCRSMKGVSEQLGETEVPFKFRVLELDTTDVTKAIIVRKIDTMNRMGMDSGESQKLRVWVESILRVPFGKVVPLPVNIHSGVEPCAKFISAARTKLDKATYGMEGAKMQIMQTIAQWISNPDSMGNCIALQGPAGVGKTSFARNGIASVLERPFMFFSLGGASDIAHYTGHSYTYEGSTWGRIIDAIIQSKCMNPVLYFDELDKISGTPHGEEIVSMLIHLTDRTQNSQYHDRYFAGVDFDLSKCLFVFSYNDESKVNPILKDRMTVIHCQGYKDPEKKVIVANYVWPEMLARAGIPRSDLTATEAAADYIVKEYSNGEQGMRSMIRVVETVVSRINLLRITDEESRSKYKFAVPVKFPMVLDVPTVTTLLSDFSPKEPETWRSLYM